MEGNTYSDNLHPLDWGLAMVIWKSLPTKVTCHLQLQTFFVCSIATAEPVMNSRSATAGKNHLIAQLHEVTVKDRAVLILPSLLKN